MVKVINWNPRQNLLEINRFVKIKRLKRINNFGDLIGPLIVNEVVKRKKIRHAERFTPNKRLLTVGSILHFAKNQDTIWGTGRNGKIADELHRFEELDVRAVRGPLTREFLLGKGIDCPEIYGDPALLLPEFFENFKVMSRTKEYDLTIIPNLNDLETFRKYSDAVIHPCGRLESIIERIVKSRFVVGSSLHAIIVAESFGVPARLIEGNSESPFKYEDYYLGTGRLGYTSSKNLMSAMEMGGEPSIKISFNELFESFPVDIY